MATLRARRSSSSARSSNLDSVSFTARPEGAWLQGARRRFRRTAVLHARWRSEHDEGSKQDRTQHGRYVAIRKRVALRADSEQQAVVIGIVASEQIAVDRKRHRTAISR